MVRNGSLPRLTCPSVRAGSGESQRTRRSRPSRNSSRYIMRAWDVTPSFFSMFRLTNVVSFMKSTLYALWNFVLQSMRSSLSILQKVALRRQRMSVETAENMLLQTFWMLIMIHIGQQMTMWSLLPLQSLFLNHASSIVFRFRSISLWVRELRHSASRLSVRTVSGRPLQTRLQSATSVSFILLSL